MTPNGTVADVTIEAGATHAAEGSADTPAAEYRIDELARSGRDDRAQRPGLSGPGPHAAAPPGRAGGSVLPRRTSPAWS